jgi:hypothetical protein
VVAVAEVKMEYADIESELDDLEIAFATWGDEILLKGMWLRGAAGFMQVAALC